MKKIFVAVLIVLLVASAGLFAAGSQEKGAKDDVTVVFVPKLTGNAFFEAANDGAQVYAAKQGFTVKYDGSPEASVANQVTVIDNAINTGADAVVVSSVDATGLDDIMKDAMKAGVKAVTWDSDVSGDARTVMVSQGTPDILGKMLVDMLADSVKERGKNPAKDPVKYVWHYSQATVADQNSWRVAGEAYIQDKYPNWINLNPSNYYSEQDAEKAITIGEAILMANPDIDGIICNDSTALPGQAQAAQNLGLDENDVSITGFAPPNSMKNYARADILARWGLWDCQVQGALGCYLGYYLAIGNDITVGDVIDVPDIGRVEVLPNTVLDANAYTASNSGVVLLPERVVFTTENMDNYDF